MRSPTASSKSRDWRHTIVLVGFSLLLANCGGGGDGDGGGGGGGGPCDDPEIIVNECDAAGESCPSPDDYASVCAPDESGCGLECVNICETSRDFPDGSVDVGDRCEFDDDCAGTASCDNDVAGAAATCLCTDPPVNVCENDLKVAFFSPVLGTSCIAADYVQLNRPSPGDFRLKRTCRRVDGSCFESYEEIGIGRRTESETDLCWVDDDDDHRRGRLCGTDFNFAETPASGEYETGVFRFSSNQDFTAQFIIYGSPGGSVVARCTGRGRTDSAGAPPDPPDCTEYHPFGN